MPSSGLVDDSRTPPSLNLNGTRCCFIARRTSLGNMFGPKALVILIRLEYWIVNATDLARRVLRSCMACVRFEPKLENQLMGSLLPERVQPQQRFQKWASTSATVQQVCPHQKIRSHKVLSSRLHLFGVQASAHRSRL